MLVDQSLYLLRNRFALWPGSAILKRDLAKSCIDQIRDQTDEERLNCESRRPFINLIGVYNG